MISKLHALWIVIGAVSFTVVTVTLERLAYPTVVVFMAGIAFALIFEELAERFNEIEAEVNDV
jgi:hypothetical protein